MNNKETFLKNPQVCAQENSFTQISQVDCPIFFKWMSSFSILGVIVGIFLF